MGLNVHLSYVVVFLIWLASKNFLNRFGTRGNALHTELELSCLSRLRPVVAANVALSEGLSHLRCVLALLDIVKLVSETLHVLSLDHIRDVVRVEGLLTEALILWCGDLVVYHTRVNLLDTWLVLETLTVPLNVLRSAGLLFSEEIGLQAVLSALAGTERDIFACSANVWGLLISARLRS